MGMTTLDHKDLQDLAWTSLVTGAVVDRPWRGPWSSEDPERKSATVPGARRAVDGHPGPKQGRRRVKSLTRQAKGIGTSDC